MTCDGSREQPNKCLMKATIPSPRPPLEDRPGSKTLLKNVRRDTRVDTGTENDRNRVLKSLEKLEKRYMDYSNSGGILNICREEEARTRQGQDMFSAGCPLGSSESLLGGQVQNWLMDA